MNERELARIVRGALDESAEHLPFDTANRLAAARAAALARAWTRESRERRDFDGRGPGRPGGGLPDVEPRGGAGQGRARHDRERRDPRVHEASRAGRVRRGGHIHRAGLAGASPRLVWRVAAVVVPVALVTVGLFGISAWETRQRAEDLTELDAAMLVDDVPIAAYADRGFGVFLRNVSWEDARK